MTDDLFLDTFSAWLASLGTDALVLSHALKSSMEGSGPGGGDRRGPASLVGGLNYLFKSLDLIPDGIEDLGYLDDAFVIRIAARNAVDAGIHDEALRALAKHAETIEAFLGSDFQRLAAYVEGTRDKPVRGRSPEQILNDEAIRSSFTSELDGFAAQYQHPSFTKQPRTLVKLRAFLSAKLP
jgi:uncharacterized membrane protein YkvA (DUF1232 family)